MRPDIVPGAVFPDYPLPDHTTKRRKLSGLQGKELFHPSGKPYVEALRDGDG